MQQITLPEKPVIVKQEGNYAMFEIRACYPGYGMTLGNAFRRVLLSSLQGAAITSVKIVGVNHEFSTITGVLEDVVEIVLNLKRVRFKMYTDEPVKLHLKVKKEGAVTADSISKADNVEVINSAAHIATITNSSTVLEMEFTVEKGVGYLPVEQQENEKAEIGVIGVDAIFTPVKMVNYRVEHMRVGKMTNYDKLILEIETDGSRTPEEAFRQAVVLLVEHFNLFKDVNVDTNGQSSDSMLEYFEVGNEKTENEGTEEEQEVEAVPSKKTVDSDKEVLKTSIEDLALPVRVLKVLQENKIKTVAKLVGRTEEGLSDLPGMGEKGIKDIKKAIGKLGLTLKG